jgi:4-amino-4-deoxy-L-arabinose transferase-like glycosyltransferase
LEFLQMNARNPSVLHITLLVGLCVLLYFPYLGSTPFFDKGEPREALAVQDIVQRGEWLVPLKRATEVPSKPPLFHWTAALTARITGKLNEVTIRFPSALYATLGVLLLYAFGRKLFGADTALLAAAILATTQVYAHQALNARVDMTLCFFVTLSLVLFYLLYDGFLTRSFWYYAFYAVVGIGTLAKGPLGILLPALVAGVFLVAKKRWDLLAKFCFHPGVILTLVLGAGWYVIAVTREGERFFDRQILQENLERFFGRSGHNHPFYYYLPYLFSQGLPWGLLLPFFLWDFFRNKLSAAEGSLFLKLWFVAMLLFFSVAMGKRPVYLLPLYPALALLMGAWIYDHGPVFGGRKLLYRAVALMGGSVGLLLLVITVGAMWNHDSGWFFEPIERLLRAKDRANLVAVTNALDSFGWSFTAVSLVAAALWLSFARCLWFARMRLVAQRLVLIAIVQGFVAWTIFEPVIAHAKSYRPFMEEVNRRVNPDDKLFLYGRSFNSDPVVFYRGGPIERLDFPKALMAAKVGYGNSYVIMAQRNWNQLQKFNPGLPPPLLKSIGRGPEGDAPLVMVRAQAS